MIWASALILSPIDHCTVRFSLSITIFIFVLVKYFIIYLYTSVITIYRKRILLYIERIQYTRYYLFEIIWILSSSSRSEIIPVLEYHLCTI